MKIMKNCVLTVVGIMVFFTVAFANEKQENKVSYYRVDIVANVSTSHITPEKIVEDEMSGGRVCIADTKLELQLWYPMEGGHYSYQKSTIGLVKYDCPPYGKAVDCIETPLADAYDLRKVKFDTSLYLKEKNSTNHIKLFLSEIPPLFPFKVRIQCPGGTPADVSDYGVTFNQVFTALNNNPQTLPVILNKTTRKTSVMKVFNLYKVTINWEIKSTVHSILNVD